MTTPTPAQVEALIAETEQLADHYLDVENYHPADILYRAASALAALRDENAALRSKLNERMGVVAFTYELPHEISQPEHVGLTCEEAKTKRSERVRASFQRVSQKATTTTIIECLQRMIASAEVYTDAEGIVTAYKIKTGALHNLIGLLELTVPVNLPEAKRDRLIAATGGEGWIRSGERQPTDAGEYVVVCEDGHVTADEWRVFDWGGQWWQDTHGSHGSVKYWMPLPAAPQVGDDNDQPH